MSRFSALVYEPHVSPVLSLPEKAPPKAFGHQGKPFGRLGVAEPVRSSCPWSLRPPSSWASEPPQRTGRRDAKSRKNSNIPKKMIQIQTILKVADNSGAKTVKCIKILGKSKYASVGDCILVSVRSVRSNLLAQRKEKSQQTHKKRGSSRVQKGQIFKALVIRTRKGAVNRPYGNSIFFQSNDVVLIDEQNRPIGSRTLGPITRELRALGRSATISQATRML